jgi:hypothetical protein
MTASDFLTKKVKPLINGSGTTKWSDDRLVEALNEGMEELAKEARITRGNYVIPVLPYTREVDLPSDLLDLTQVKYNQVPITLTTFDKMNTVTHWEERVSDKDMLEYIIYDKQELGKLTLYPLLSATAIDFGALASTTGIILDVPGVESDSVVGLITSVDTYDYISPENVYNPDSILPEEGGLTAVSNLFGFLEIKYIQRPLEVSTDDLTTELPIDVSFITALKYYIAGHVLLDEGRNEALAKGKTFINRYATALNEIKGRTGDNFQSIRGQTMNYRTPFNQ